MRIMRWRLLVLLLLGWLVLLLRLLVLLLRLLVLVLLLLAALSRLALLSLLGCKICGLQTLATSEVDSCHETQGKQHVTGLNKG